VPELPAAAVMMHCTVCPIHKHLPENSSILRLKNQLRYIFLIQSKKIQDSSLPDEYPYETFQT
jgi:hypothetical protein